MKFHTVALDKINVGKEPVEYGKNLLTFWAILFHFMVKFYTLSLFCSPNNSFFLVFSTLKNNPISDTPLHSAVIPKLL